MSSASKQEQVPGAGLRCGTLPPFAVYAMTAAERTHYEVSQIIRGPTVGIQFCEPTVAPTAEVRWTTQCRQLVLDCVKEWLVETCLAFEQVHSGQQACQYAHVIEIWIEKDDLTVASFTSGWQSAVNKHKHDAKDGDGDATMTTQDAHQQRRYISLQREVFEHGGKFMILRQVGFALGLPALLPLPLPTGCAFDRGNLRAFMAKEFKWTTDLTDKMLLGGLANERPPTRDMGFTVCDPESILVYHLPDDVFAKHKAPPLVKNHEPSYQDKFQVRRFYPVKLSVRVFLPAKTLARRQGMKESSSEFTALLAACKAYFEADPTLAPRLAQQQREEAEKAAAKAKAEAAKATSTISVSIETTPGSNTTAIGMITSSSAAATSADSKMVGQPQVSIAGANNVIGALHLAPGQQLHMQFGGGGMNVVDGNTGASSSSSTSNSTSSALVPTGHRAAAPRSDPPSAGPPRADIQISNAKRAIGRVAPVGTPDHQLPTVAMQDVDHAIGDVRFASRTSHSSSSSSSRK